MRLALRGIMAVACASRCEELRAAIGGSLAGRRDHDWNRRSMRIQTVESTRDRLHLIIRLRMWLMLGFGVLFLALGILTIWLLPYETVVSVEGRHLTYELKFLGLFTVESISLPATEIAGISIELVTGISRSYEVRIDAPPQPWRLWLPSADGDTKRRIANGLTAALASPDGRFQHRDSAVILSLCLAAVPIVGALVILSLVQIIEVVGDRAARTLSFRRRSLLAVRSKRTVMPFDAIDEIEAVLVHNAGPKLSSYHVVVFGTDDSGHYLSKAPLFRAKEAETVAKTLSGWLAKARRRN